MVYMLLKRLFDIIIGLIGMLLIIPFAIIIKILYLINKDYDSIFYIQKRIGHNGKEFNMFKFRTMSLDADEELDIILKKDNNTKEKWDKYQKLDNDPRTTKLGKIIRKYSIDEIPQFINVFIGNMSYIGNRPYLPREKQLMGKYYKEIVKTKPGLTGLWQVSLRKRGTFKDRLKIESFYSNNYSIKMDIKIFLKTFVSLG